MKTTLQFPTRKFRTNGTGGTPCHPVCPQGKSQTTQFPRNRVVFSFCVISNCELPQAKNAVGSSPGRHGVQPVPFAYISRNQNRMTSLRISAAKTKKRVPSHSLLFCTFLLLKSSFEPYRADVYCRPKTFLF